ncbi:cytoskeleton-associated protein 2 [Ambystoma mexicanum]|uniref:cytoskeleton-associated protein 2 n=1 Tax=Ambystoma mexicanum TaxID=8296 RepID=UPI0037E9B0EB
MRASSPLKLVSTVTERRRQKIDEHFSKRRPLCGAYVNVNRAQSRGNSNKLKGVTIRKKPNCKNPALQEMEDKENAGRKPVQAIVMERTTPAVLKTIQSPNLCATSEINKSFEILRLEEMKSVESLTACVSIGRSLLLKSTLSEKHPMAYKDNSDVQVARNVVPGSVKLKSNVILSKRPVSGVYRGKVVQAKINSFRKVSEKEPSENQDQAIVVSRKTSDPQPLNSAIPTGRKTVKSKIKSNNPLNKVRFTVSKQPAKPHDPCPLGTRRKAEQSRVHNVVEVNNKAVGQLGFHNGKPTAGQSSSTVTNRTIGSTSMSTSVKFRNPSFAPCGTKVSANCRPGSMDKLKQPPKTGSSNGKTHSSGSSIISSDLRCKRPFSSAVTLRRKTCPTVKPFPHTGQTSAVSTARKSHLSHIAPVASSNTVSGPSRKKTVSEILTAVSTRFVHPKEFAEEQRARLAQWQASKGKVMKRPPMVAMKLRPPEVLKEPVQSVPESIRNELRRLSIEEGQRTESECTKSDQPMGDLQNVLSDQNVASPKYETEEPMKEEQNNNDELVKPKEKGMQLVKDGGGEGDVEVKTILKVEKTGKTRFRKLHAKGCHRKAEDEKAEEVRVGLSSQFMSPDNDPEGSTVIRFNVRTTPSLKSLTNNMHNQLGDSTFKDLKFLTPVRRSLRIERKSFKLPDMLHDHDPCLASLGELAELGGETHAYIFRENSALRELAKDCNPLKEN